jgi:hypothetical protein
MKAKFIPPDKQSKREQKARNAKQRRDWGEFNPVTRKTDNAKAYNRKKSKRNWQECEPRLDFFSINLRLSPSCDKLPKKW